MPQFYIAEQSQVRSKLHSLSEVSVSLDQWTHEYKDVITAEHWQLCTPNPQAGRDAFLLLKKLPLLGTDEVIQLALYSTDNNNIAGAIFDLVQREAAHQEDFRMKLIEALKDYIRKPNSRFDPERVKLLIDQCDLLNPRNRREVLGKPYEEVEEDANYFKTVAKQAKEILVDLHS